MTMEHPYFQRRRQPRRAETGSSRRLEADLELLMHFVVTCLRSRITRKVVVWLQLPAALLFVMSLTTVTVNTNAR
jgi:hypothetical protein